MSTRNKIKFKNLQEAIAHIKDSATQVEPIKTDPVSSPDSVVAHKRGEINVNGIVYTNIEDLEAAIKGLSEDEKLCIRNDFNGVASIEAINPVPSIVTPRQIRLALVISGSSISTIESAIDSLPEPHRSVAKVTWDYSLEFQRDNPLLASVGAALGLTGAQIDQLFMLAATL